eukprot:CAMPEP_0172759406 /NCGR_PEP_ID=MMETSP1074-20121228/167695_1 /TAXON_ID=2916 /ORGANISM="Ceratium fusus, Strain PA161109" /LENGTH=71 /DNA_ID=CAMNT_0013593181 /DNA_START=296 /DNA_END=511 /DNA_ORIENTATION=+
MSECLRGDVLAPRVCSAAKANQSRHEPLAKSNVTEDLLMRGEPKIPPEDPVVVPKHQPSPPRHKAAECLQS